VVVVIVTERAPVYVEATGENAGVATFNV